MKKILLLFSLLNICASHSMEDQEKKEASDKSLLDYYETDSAEKMQTLLASNVDINQKFDLRFTRMHVAVAHKQTEVIKFLIKNKADVNITDNFWRYTPLIYACYLENSDIVKILLEEKADITPKEIHGRTAMDVAELIKNKSNIELLKAHQIAENVLMKKNEDNEVLWI